MNPPQRGGRKPRGVMGELGRVRTEGGVPEALVGEGGEERFSRREIR